MYETKFEQFKLVNLSFFLVFLSVSFAAPSLFAQSQHAETWSFGKRCRLSFDNNTVVSTQDPKINVLEGSASFSNPGTGELIVYSDGKNIWEANGDLVADDLLGGPSVMHGVVIVPRPQNPNKLYVISHLRDASTSISTREVDLTDPTEINTIGENVTIELDAGLDSAREGMLVVPHKNGIDFWIIVSGDKSVFVLSVTTAGLGTPVKYETAIPYGRFGLFAISNDGTILVISEADSSNKEGVIYSLIFDPENGEIKSVNGVAEKTNLTTNNELRKYGGAFSPDDTKLYYATLGENNTTPPVGSILFQYDFTNKVHTLIDRQRLGFIHSQAKLAQNGKIYVSSGFSVDSVLSVIENPNAKAADITFTFGSVQLDSACNPGLGLPQTITPLADVTLGIEINRPSGTVNDSKVTPSGNANLPDGTKIIVTLRGDDGSEQSCEAEVQSGKWACSEDAFKGLEVRVKYTVVATDSTHSGTTEFTRRECVAGETCDVNECETRTNNCDPDATCTDTLNGFACACNAPFIGNGVTCSPPGVVEDMGMTDGGTGDAGMMDIGVHKPDASITIPLALAGGPKCSSITASSASFWLLILVFVGFRKRKKK